MTDQWGNILDGYDESDQQQIGGASFPTIQWVNGKRDLSDLKNHPKHTGGWFLPSDNAERLDLTPESLKAWTPGEMSFGDGSGTGGFFIRDLTVSVIAWRRAWEVAGDRRVYFPWNQYDDAVAAGATMGAKARSRAQILVGVKGFPPDAIASLTLHGMTQKFFFDGLALANRYLIAPAAAMSKRGRKAVIPLRMFWLDFGPKRDAKGAPEYMKVGDGSASSFITPCALLGLEGKQTPEQVMARFVDEDRQLLPNLTYFDSVFRDPSVQEWVHQWDTARDNEPATTARDTEPEVDESEVPF